MSSTSTRLLLYSGQVKQGRKAHFKASSMQDYRKYLSIFQNFPLSFIRQPPHISTNSCPLASLYRIINVTYPQIKLNIIFASPFVLQISTSNSSAYDSHRMHATQQKGMKRNQKRKKEKQNKSRQNTLHIVYILRFNMYTKYSRKDGTREQAMEYSMVFLQNENNSDHTLHYP